MSRSTTVTQRPQKGRTAAALVFAAALSALTVPSALAAAGAEDTPTAQDLFDEVIYDLALHYSGPSPLRAQDLREEFLPRIQAACAGQSVCGAKAAYPAIDAVIGKLNDDHTNFFPPAGWESLARASAGQGERAPSFGLQVQPLPGQGTLVLETIPGSPGAEAGLQPGDLITRVGRLPLGTGPLAASKLAAAGRSGQPIQLTYTRAGQQRTAELTGDSFPVPAVSLTMLDSHTALVRLRHFDTQGVAQDLHGALRRATQQGATRLVLDLRRNPGGYLTETLLSAGALTEPAPLKEVRRSSSDLLSYREGRYLENGTPVPGARVFKPQRFTGPLAVLIDGDSASGAEFLARDLLARPRTAVLGQATAGVADTATSLFDLSGGAGLQITTARIQDAAGRPLPPRVQPQVVLTKDYAAFTRTGQDPELAAAVQALGGL